MDTLRIRVYNVLFGDAIFITVPDKDETTGVTTNRNILIDVGNVLSKRGKKDENGNPGKIIGDDEVFLPVLEDVKKELKGKPLDLYVMTHDHLDHVQGLFYCSSKHKLNLDVDYSWLTASAEGDDYYDKFPNAKREMQKFKAMFEGVEKYFKFSAAEKSLQVQSLLANNNPSSTKQCVDYLRKLAKKKTSYVFRDSKPEHSFTEAKFEILGPEEDTSDYYGKFQPIHLGVSDVTVGNKTTSVINESIPPNGVDAGAFFNLVDARKNGLFDNLLAIDKAANNVSVVFTMEWRGYRFLFCGDAEQKSWKTIEKNAKNKLKPIHFLKVSHHGSSNGLPILGVLDDILPKHPPDNKPRFAAVSTCLGAYNGVPHDDTLGILKQRCQVKSTKDDLIAGKNYFDLTFKG
jgi:hypothetical protein